jgi:hypothetical protein
VKGDDSVPYDSEASMDWTGILYFIDEAVGPKKMPTRHALEASVASNHEIVIRRRSKRSRLGLSQQDYDGWQNAAEAAAAGRHEMTPSVRARTSGEARQVATAS